MKKRAWVDQERIVLVVGGGGREHAIGLKLAGSPKVSKVLISPGNGGTDHGNEKIGSIVCPLSTSYHLYTPA